MIRSNIIFLSLCLFANILIAQDRFKLLWQDDFTGRNLDTAIWIITEGNGCPDICGFGNNEKQFYSKNNLVLEEGKLVITARKEEMQTNAYTSAKITSKAKHGIRYGKVEVSAKLPSGTGLWPAIWMLPSEWKYGGWPESGEIDIMEYVGYNPNTIFGTVHTESFNHLIGSQIGDSIKIGSLQNEFHLFSIEWTPSEITFLVDNQAYFVFKNLPEYGPKEWPFDQQFDLILNLAVGGNWGGRRGIDNSVFPAEFCIDFVKMYQYLPDLNRE